MNSNAPTNNTSAPTITPNTLNAITGALNSNSYHQPSPPQDSSYIPSANNAASTAANGLFLLSQAHHELTKREEEAALANSTSVNSNSQSNGKRSSKRKSYDMSPPPQPSRGHPKRSRAATNGRGRKSSPRDLSDEMDDGDDDPEDDDLADHDDDAHSTNSKRVNKKPETEEEKRKNFLERNRQGTSSSSWHAITFLHFSSKLLSNAGNGKKHGLLTCKAK
jgi:ATF/CREB family transcription factor